MLGQGRPARSWHDLRVQPSHPAVKALFWQAATPGWALNRFLSKHSHVPLQKTALLELSREGTFSQLEKKLLQCLNELPGCNLL